MKKTASALIAIFLFTGSPGAADNSSGLTELTMGQTANSIFLSVESAMAFDLYYRQTVGLSILLFASGIVTPQIAGKKWDFDTSRARSINCASLWGASTGVLIGLTADFEDMKTQAYTGMAADIAATSAASWHTSDEYLSVDSLAVMNSGGIWGIYTGFAVMEIADADIRYTPAFLLLGQSGGLAAAFFLAKEEQITQARMAAIDLMMLFGTGLGYGSAYLAGADKRTRWITGIIGTALGATAGWYSTKGWAEPGTAYRLKAPAGSARNIQEPEFYIALPAFTM